MYRAFSLAFLVGGVVLLIIGVSAAQSLGSEISQFFTGAPANKAIWLLIGGVVLAVIGLVGLLRGSKASG